MDFHLKNNNASSPGETRLRPSTNSHTTEPKKQVQLRLNLNYAYACVASKSEVFKEN